MINNETPQTEGSAFLAATDDSNDALAVARLLDAAANRWGNDSPEYTKFWAMLVETYNNLSPEHDFDLDIG